LLYATNCTPKITLVITSNIATSSSVTTVGASSVTELGGYHCTGTFTRGSSALSTTLYMPTTSYTLTPSTPEYSTQSIAITSSGNSTIRQGVSPGTSVSPSYSWFSVLLFSLGGFMMKPISPSIDLRSKLRLVS
jgi:hypothetical protein